ncbi:MAG: type II secretion system GspH family protein [Lachnospiraceae bacterium]|nr:type II secretion system GspH family protein [Lachnospiraceae bacterium]
MAKNVGYKPDKNAGYSLIELIVIISIMAVMVGILSFGLSLMFSRDAEYVAKTIDDELAEVRMLSMSKDGVFVMKLHIDSDPSQNKIVIERGGAEYKTVDIKKSASLKVNYGTEEKTSGDVKFEFDKANGSVKAIDGDPDNAVGVCTITATSSKLSSKTAMVDLVATTGRHYVRK